MAKFGPSRLLTIALASITCMQLLPAFSSSPASAPDAAALKRKPPGDDELARVKGEVGIAVVDTSRKTQFLYNENKPFPMQSVCKFPLSVAILLLADAGKLSVEDKVTVRLSDVIPYNSPIKDRIKGKQSDFSIRELMSSAIRDSDNTACDVLINRAGGAKKVTSILSEAGIKNVRIDRPEGTLQPDSRKIDEFLADPRDTATPYGMVDLLKQLYGGKLLSEKSKEIILGEMFGCRTGSQRIKAGMPEGWKLAHKTGTGGDFAGQNAGTNDVGIMVGPKGEVIYIAIFIKGSKASLEKREAFMAKIAARAVAGEL